MLRVDLLAALLLPLLLVLLPLRLVPIPVVQFGSLLHFVASLRPPIHSVGLHLEQHGESIVRVLRAGATEYLFAPFGELSQREVGDRIARLSQPEEPASAHAANCCRAPAAASLPSRQRAPTHSRRPTPAPPPGRMPAST